MKKILVVDDEKPISDIVKFNLTKEGFEVFTAFDGEEALEAFKEVQPDLILLDLMLPKLDGLDVAREIRKTSDTPIIMVSAKDSEFDKVIGLELAESTDNVKKELIIGNLRINPAHYAAYKNDKQLDLTHREFELLYYLAQHLGEVITRENLLETVWGYDYFGDVRTVDVTVRRLREKVEDTPSRPQYVSTRRGVGYYMSNPHD